MSTAQLALQWTLLIVGVACLWSWCKRRYHIVGFFLMVFGVFYPIFRIAFAYLSVSVDPPMGACVAIRLTSVPYFTALIFWAGCRIFEDYDDRLRDPSFKQWIISLAFGVLTAVSFTKGLPVEVPWILSVSLYVVTIGVIFIGILNSYGLLVSKSDQGETK